MLWQFQGFPACVHRWVAQDQFLQRLDDIWCVPFPRAIISMQCSSYIGSECCCPFILVLWFLSLAVVIAMKRKVSHRMKLVFTFKTNGLAIVVVLPLQLLPDRISRFEAVPPLIEVLTATSRRSFA